MNPFPEQSMPVYALFLLIFFAIPVLLLGWFLRADFRRYRRTVLWCLAFVFTLGGTWDWLAYRTGLWRYDSAKTLGIWIDGLPVEEFLGFYLLGTLLMVSVAFAILKKKGA